MNKGRGVWVAVHTTYFGIISTYRTKINRLIGAAKGVAQALIWSKYKENGLTNILATL